MKRILLTLLTLALLAPFAFADEASLGGVGGNVYVENNEDVAMQSEVIQIDVYSGDADDWEDQGEILFDVQYVFDNTTDETIEVMMGFPEKCAWGCEYEQSEQRLKTFKAFQKSNGEWEEVSVEYQLDESEENKYSQDNWHVSTVEFVPGINEIRNTYSISPSFYKQGLGWFDYVLETGASWKGEIEQVDIYVNFHDEMTVYGVYGIRPEAFEFNTEENQIEWHLNNLEPTGEDNIYIRYRDPELQEFGCDVFPEDSKHFASSTLAPEGDDPYSSTSYYPCKASDNKISTAWVEGVEGHGIGESIELQIPLDRISKQITIFTGYAETEKLWKQNSRVAELLLTFPSGLTQTIQLEDIFGYQTFHLDENLETDEPLTVFAEIIDVYEGTKYEDTALSEIRLEGLIAEASEYIEPYEAPAILEEPVVESVQEPESEENSFLITLVIALGILMVPIYFLLQRRH